MSYQDKIKLNISVLSICILLLFVLSTPFRNYIPPFWAVFVVFICGLKYWLSYRRLMKMLTRFNNADLSKMNLSIEKSRWSSTISPFGLMRNGDKIQQLSIEVKDEFLEFRFFFHFLWIAFLLFPIMGIITVISAR